MSEQIKEGIKPDPVETAQALERVLAVGRILRSVLTEEELAALAQALNGYSEQQPEPDMEIGNNDST